MQHLSPPNKSPNLPPFLHQMKTSSIEILSKETCAIWPFPPLSFVYLFIHSFVCFFKHNSLSLLWKFHIMDPNPAHLPVLSYLPLNPAWCTPKLDKKQNKKTHLMSPSFQHFFMHPIGIRVAACNAVYPFWPNSPSCKMFPAVSHGLVQSPWLLVHHHHWSLIEMPRRYPIVAKSHGATDAIIPQDQSPHTLQ